MSIKQKITTFIIALSSIGLVSTATAPLVSADCGGVKTSIINCSAKGNEKNAKKSAVWQVLLIVLNILTAGIGVAAVGGIVYGSILYTTAADRPEQTKKAIGIITNVVIGIIAYILMYAFLQFLIPGGVLN